MRLKIPSLVITVRYHLVELEQKCVPLVADQPSDTQPVKGGSTTTRGTPLTTPSLVTTTSTTILPSQGTTDASVTQTTEVPVPTTPGGISFFLFASFHTQPDDHFIAVS